MIVALAIALLVLTVCVAALTALLLSANRKRDTSLAENAELRAEIRVLKERLTVEREQTAEKLDLLKDAKDRLSQEFKLLAHGVMKEQSETFAKQNREQIGHILTPLKESLTTFQQGMATAHT